MPGLLKPRNENPGRSKTVRRKMKGEERTLRAQTAKVGSDKPSETAEAVVPFEGAPTKIAAETPTEKTKIKKIRDGLIVEQTISYSSGKGKPILHARIRLTTAVRGKKKQDSLQSAAYLLRLEVLDASEGIVVEGLILGPWEIKELALEPGSIHVTEPLWTSFQSVQVACKGRVHLGDTVRNRMLDLPLKVTSVVPGPELFSA